MHPSSDFYVCGNEYCDSTAISRLTFEGFKTVKRCGSIHTSSTEVLALATAESSDATQRVQFHSRAFLHSTLNQSIDNSLSPKDHSYVAPLS